MMFLLRTAFWLGIVLILLPSGGNSADKPAKYGAVETLSAAGAAVADMRGICVRQPDVCAVSEDIASMLGQRLQAGAHMVLEFISERMKASDDAAAAAAAAKGDGGKVPLPPVRRPNSQHTLTSDDLAPEWRHPARPERDRSA